MIEPDFDQEAKDRNGDDPPTAPGKASHVQLGLSYLLKHGEATHFMFEDAFNCTTIRTVVSKLRKRYGWEPYIGKDKDPNVKIEGLHAHYHVRWRDLSLACGVRPEELRTLAWKADPRDLGTFEEFKVWVRSKASEVLGEYALQAEDPFGTKSVRLEGRA